MTSISLNINGRAVSDSCTPRTHLGDFLREQQTLTGLHLGCEQGVCGACTVLVDDVPVRSCITFAVACSGAEVTTIEGLDDDEVAAELRTAFSREHALQCGFCTPGMMISARDLVLRLEDADEARIRHAMSGNLCRCTGYVGIIRAIQSVIRDRRARGIEPIGGAGRARLGPAGSGYAEAEAASSPASTGVAASKPAASRASAPAPAIDADWVPQTTLTESFTVAHPVDQVWAFFADIPQVASCLPGARLTEGPDENGHVAGQMRAKVGPITAEFQGEAQIVRDEAARRSVITGQGKDRSSNSATRGRVTYSVREGDEPGSTLVEVEIGFTLTGALAQFSRSGLVKGVANRLTEMFAQNLEARLSHQGDEQPPEVAETFDAGSMVGSVIFGAIGRFFRRFWPGR